MSIKSNLMHEACIRHCEEFFMDRVSQLVDKFNIDDADALHGEFVVDGDEPDDWLFINDLTNV
jgi:hypothetical protein